MALDTYTSLRSTIVAYGIRTDLLSYIDTFIEFAETEMWTVLKVREMEARATASISTSDRFLALPSDYASMRKYQIIIDSELFDLDYVIPAALEIDSTEGPPSHYTITSQIEFNRVSDQAYTVEMQYFRKLTGLSASNATNDILTNYPRIYLAGCMKYFAERAREFELSGYWANEFNVAMAKANRQSRKGRYTRPAKFLI